MRRLGGLWQHSSFLQFWTGQTISLFGSQVTTLALPLTAAIVLKASPAQMALLTTASTLPALLSLLIGVWVDRLPRRAIMIAADVGRAGVLGSIPVAAYIGLLTIEQLFIAAFLAGLLSLWFDIASPAFLPALIPLESLTEGNSKLEVSRSLAEIIGPGLAGSLVQILTAPFSIVIDAFSFLISAYF